MLEDKKELRVGERRRGRREPVSGKLRLFLEAQTIEGEADNASRSGILFFTDNDLRVEVEFEEEGQKVRKRGKLVRCERIRGTRCGWAVEFERG